MPAHADRLALERARRLALPLMLERAARRAPGKAALVFGEQQRTFAQLDARAGQLAAALAQRGVRAGDRVALLLHNGFEIVEAFFGCQKLSACPVPVNFRLAQGELRYILEDSGAVGLISGPEVRDLAIAAANGLDALAFHLAVGQTEPALEPYEPALAAAGAAPPPVLIDEDDTAFLIYTSGTTGRPKGAMLTHQNLVASTLAWVQEIGAHAQDVWLSGQPLFHIGGINGLLPFIHLGATTILTPSSRFDPAAIVALLHDHRVTRCVFVPTQWQEICSQPEARELGGGRLRTALWGASAAPLATLELMARTFPGVSIVSAYGQTEMSGTTTFLKGEDSIRKIGSVGKPLVGVELRLVDDAGADVARGDIGEIVYRGAQVMAGYHERPQATDETFAGGWMHSGDLGYHDEEGFLYIVDRKKDMIVSGGENVYPAEVEHTIREHPSVADVAVVGIDHPRWVETPLAVVILHDGAHATEEELIEHCRGALAGYKKPSGVVFVDALPRNAAGKVLKRELRERYRARLTTSA